MNDWLHPQDPGYPHEELTVTTPGAVQTEAGRALLDRLDGYPFHDDEADVARIEAEAVALFKQGLAEKVMALLMPMEHLPARLLTDPDDIPRCRVCGFLIAPRNSHARDCPMPAVLSLITGDSNADREG